MNTPPTKTNQNINKSEMISEIKLSYDKLEYNIALSILEKENILQIEAKLLNSIIMYSFNAQFKLEDLIKINNYFKCINDINEVKNLILEGYSKKKIEISSKNKNELILSLNFYSGFDEKKVDFILLKKKIR